MTDLDSQRLIDFGSGIAVTTVGNSGPAVAVGYWAADPFTHACFIVTP
jgi:4-aminobutyrate aminotransferase/(S)-3-amino-2-methylpropionate transaminase